MTLRESDASAERKSGAEMAGERLAGMAAMPFLVDSLLRIEHLRVATQVRSSHLKRSGRVCAETDRLLDQFNALEDYATKRVGVLIEDHPAYPWFSKVKGVGRENIAKVVGLVDIEKAPHVSSLWKFAGYAVNGDGRAPKRTKGETLAYCSQLRTMCYRLGGSLMKARGPYYDYYCAEKAKYETRFRAEGKEIVPAAQLPKVDGKKRETDQHISEGHIHNMALRKMVKLFLAHLWVEWRRGAGLPVSGPYVEDKLGHEHIIEPWDMVAE